MDAQPDLCVLDTIEMGYNMSHCAHISYYFLKRAPLSSGFLSFQLLRTFRCAPSTPAVDRDKTSEAEQGYSQSDTSVPSAYFSQILQCLLLNIPVNLLSDTPNPFLLPPLVAFPGLATPAVAANIEGEAVAVAVGCVDVTLAKLRVILGVTVAGSAVAVERRNARGIRSLDGFILEGRKSRRLEVVSW